MPKPKTKDELLHLSQENFQKLFHFIEQMSKEEQARAFPKGTMNRNIRDVLAHLHHWHLLFLNWYEVGMAGGKPDMPATGYTWKMNAQLNRWIWQQYQDMALEQAKIKLKESFNGVKKIINKHSQEELFEKKRYHWTGSTSLGAYLISATSSHYDWALKLIKKQVKQSRSH